MPLPAARVALATWPSPLEPAPRLAVALGLLPDDLWLERDDLAGPAGGGNEIRKLERTCAEALATGADVLVTSGLPQSNHARLTAAAAARLGLGATLVLEGEAPERERGNLLLDRLLGADVVWAGVVDAAGLADAVEDAAEGLRRQGRRPHVVPLGGSSPLAARAYADAAAEIEEQRPSLDHLVVALGSGGTTAGPGAGLGAARVLAVHTGAVADPARTVRALLAGMASRPASPGAAGPGGRRLRLPHRARAGGPPAARAHGGPGPRPDLHRPGPGRAGGRRGRPGRAAGGADRSSCTRAGCRGCSGTRTRRGWPAEPVGPSGAEPAQPSDGLVQHGVALAEGPAHVRATLPRRGRRTPGAGWRPRRSDAEGRGRTRRRRRSRAGVRRWS